MGQDAGIRGELRRLFLRTDVFALAIAVVVGTALFRALYATIQYVVIPFARGMIQGKADSDYPSFEALYLTFNGYTVYWGEVLASAITLLIAVLLVLYLAKRFTDDEYEDESEGPEFDEESALRPCPECLSQIPAMARRCAFCTAPVEPLPQPSQE